MAQAYDYAILGNVERPVGLCENDAKTVVRDFHLCYECYSSLRILESSQEETRRLRRPRAAVRWHFLLAFLAVTAAWVVIAVMEGFFFP